ncbi:M3 family oligoendopeptidase [Bacillus sp. RO2]|uniref:hypothetical protein n=1 Tax=Bacillus sp. RO2 TaxID=2723913 RepID=UPI00145E4EA0|nr:hypothetical protein [Bacillus sp. RO2]NMH74578.1 M3 family oligoendopeptidase [Bacillus sp. RO2]
MRVTKDSQVWNLNNIFPDGSNSFKFQEHLKYLETKVCDLENLVIRRHSCLALKISFLKGEINL